MGTLRNYDGDGNGNDVESTAVGLGSKIRTLQVHHPFFVDIFAVPCTWPDQILSLLDKRIGN